MHYEGMDQVDQRLIAELRRNGRASISELAARLELARATVKVRLDRLIETGVIQGFTIDVASGEALPQVRAVVLIALEGSMSRAVIRSLASVGPIARLHSTNGAWDLVAELECAALREFDATLRQIREVPGVRNSESCLLLDRVG